MEITTKRHRIVSVLLFIALLTGHVDSSTNGCVHKGRVYTSLDWYGYLLQKTFQQNVSRIQYTIWYPASECCANLLVYYDDQIRNLTQNMTCKQRESALTPVKQVKSTKLLITILTVIMTTTTILIIMMVKMMTTTTNLTIVVEMIP